MVKKSTTIYDVYIITKIYEKLLLVCTASLRACPFFCYLFLILTLECNLQKNFQTTRLRRLAV